MTSVDAGTALLRVVAGDPTPEELAALVTALLYVGGNASEEPAVDVRRSSAGVRSRPARRWSRTPVSSAAARRRTRWSSAEPVRRPELVALSA